MHDLKRLLAQQEGQYFERKSLWHGLSGERRPRDRREVRDEIAEYVAAFANADGGTLVLGAEDDGSPSGHGYPTAAVEDMLQVPARRLRPPQTSGRLTEWEGHQLLLFDVPPAERAVMVHGDGFPRRVNDEVILESEEAINAIKSRGRNESIERDETRGVAVEGLDADLVSRARKGAGLADADAAGYLQARQLAQQDRDRAVLRRGAVLLFARHLNDIAHANAGVRIFRVEGTERRTGARHNVLEMPRIEGALPRVIEQAYAVIGTLIRGSARLHDLFFREMPEYPTFAWQEALVNAVAHRDYRQQGRCVEIWVYQDRMEVVSPGPLPAEVSIERLRRRERNHCSRNPLMTRVLADLALMREQGEGLPRMFDEMERSWLRPPELCADEHSFRVVLRNQPIFEAPDPEWIRFVEALPVAHRQRRALVAFPTGGFRSADYQALNEVDRDVAYADLKELVGLGLLTPPPGRGRGARYEVAAGTREAAAQMTPRRVLHGRMREQGFIKNADYREVFGTDRHDARRTLSALVATGVLRMEGRRRGTRYRPGATWDEWAASPQFRP